jgi:hypothetical protein
MKIINKAIDLIGFVSLVLFVGIIVSIPSWIVSEYIKSMEREIPDEQKLFNLATEKMNDILATNNFVDHNIDDCDYNCRVDRQKADGFGENLYRFPGDCSYENAFSQWLKSEKHKAILDKINTNTVLLTNHNGDYCYMVHEFIFKKDQ